MFDELWDDYLEYLIWRCGLQKMTQYSRLFEILHHINFEYILDRDENRYADGVELREDYDAFPIDRFHDQNCSVLEMLVALAIRVDDEYIGDPAEEHPEEFFMEMIENLKLDKFKGNGYREDEVIKIVNHWMRRNFDKDGYGSPFPVKHDRRDQRDLEIWDQMNSYINENYY